MATFDQAIARRHGPWCVVVRIASVGDGSGLWSFCNGIPAYAAGDPSWLPLLESIPREIPEEVDPYGGVTDAGVLDFTIVDTANVLTSALRFEADPVTDILADLDHASLSFFVRSTAGIVVGEPIHVGLEAMIVDSAGVGTITVQRGALGTDPAAHRLFSPVRRWTPRLKGREVSLYLVPQDADSAAEEVLINTFLIKRVEWPTWGSWRFTCASQLLQLKRRIGDALQGHWELLSVSGTHWALERVGTDDGLHDLSVWTGDGGRGYFLVDDQEIVIASANGAVSGVGQNGIYIESLEVEQRARLGTHRVDFDDVLNGLGNVVGKRPVVRRILAADTLEGLGAFRFIPTSAADQEDRDDPAVVQSDHVVDIMLCCFTSSRRPEDELELLNYTPGFPNWSTLPIGIGAGIRAPRINFASFLEVKARAPDFRLPGFNLREPAALGETITTRILRPFGLYVTINDGQIQLVLPRLPFEGLSPPAITEGELLSEARPISPPLISGGYEEGEKVAALITTRSASGEQVTTLITAAEVFGTLLAQDEEIGEDEVLRIDIPDRLTSGSGVDGQLEEIVARRLFRASRPLIALEGHVDLARHDIRLGGNAALTFSLLPNARTGQRGVSGALFSVLRRTLDLDLKRPGFRVGLLGYGGALPVGLIGPSALIDSWASDLATIVQRYTDAEADVLSYPNTEGGQFVEEMVCKLIAPDGTDAHVTTQVITAVSPTQLEFDGDFGVADPTGLIVVLADYAAARLEEQDRFVAFSDRANRTVGATTRPPWTHGEL